MIYYAFLCFSHLFFLFCDVAWLLPFQKLIRYLSYYWVKYSTTQKNRSVADPCMFVRLSHLAGPVNFVEAIKLRYTVFTVFNYQSSKSNKTFIHPKQRNDLASWNLILCILRKIDKYIYIYIYIYMYIYYIISSIVSKLDLNLRKKLVKCYVWSMALYGA